VSPGEAAWPGQARGISADGSVVVGYASGSSSFHTAWVWDETNGMRELQQVLTDLGIDLTGWSLEEANAISADGLTIAGAGINPLGNYEAFVATIPEPSTGLLVSIGLTGLATRRRSLRS
jgi:probable HAF family extracellular repeat protein